MKIDLLDPVISAAPGQTAVCRVRVLNDTAGPSAYRLRIVGLNDHEVEYPLGLDAVPSGMEASFDVDIHVPREFAVGRHSLALEVVSDRRGEQPALAGMTVEVASIRQVAMQINPSTIRGRLRGRFSVQLDNREPREVDLQLRGQGQDLDVDFRRSRIRMKPGDIVSIPGSVKGPRRLVRSPINHVLTVVAESASAPIYADAAFQQRPLLPGRFRSGMAVLALLGLWAGILGGGAYWYMHRASNKGPAQLQTAAVVDANGDGIPDQPLGDGSAPGTDGTAGGTGGAAGGAGGAPAKPKATKPTSTVIGGSVKAGKTGQDAGVTVSLTPALLGGVAPTPAQAASLARGGTVGRIDSAAKVWPARYGRQTVPGVSDQRRTESVVTQQTDGKGAWVFPDVLIPDNYMVTFTKPGFDTKSFIITPPEDGKAVDLDVVLDPSAGAASGVVNGPNGPIGGVDIVITDGDLTFTTKSSSQAGQVGTWSVTGLSTPNTYTLTAALRGFGTEVLQLPLTAGQQRTGIGITMTAGVGSISGHITAGSGPLGGVTISAAAGDLTRSTTSITDGDPGSYLLPQLKIPGMYTITVSADGYLTQTRQLNLTDNATAVDFDLVRTTSSIVGLVTSNTNGNLPGVGITISRDKLSFTSTTAAAPSAGSFRIDDLPPGQYLITFNRYDHAETSQLVTLAAGEVHDLGIITMAFQPRAALAQTGRLVVSIFDSGTTAINGATVQVLSVSDGVIVRTATDTAGTQSSFAFENMPIGTYTIRVTRPGYRTAVRRVTIGLSEKQLEIHMLQLGQVSGVMVSSANLAVQLAGYEIKIYRLNADGTRNGPELERITVLSSQKPDADGNILWESKPSSLIDGIYEIEVSQTPPGYFVAPQILQDGAPAMRFIVSPTDEGVLRLHEIKADPYSPLTGTVTTPKQTVDGIEFTTLKSANISLACGAGAVQTTTLVENPTVPGTYRFIFDSVQVQAATTLTQFCSVTVTATIPPVPPATTPTPDPAYSPVTVALSTALKPTPGTNNGPVINIALTKIPDAIGGKIFWVDKGAGNTPYPLSSVTVNTEGAVITGFAASETGSPTPVTTTIPIVGTSAGGNWALLGQVFGLATYVFKDPGALPQFADSRITVTINETTRTVASVNVEQVADNAGSIDVQIAPTPGTISGSIAIDSVDMANKQFTNVGVSATPPGSVTPQIVAPDGAGNFGLAAAAGTWAVHFTAPAHHVFATGASADLAPFVNPNLPTGGVNTRLVELAQLDVTVLDGAGLPIVGTQPTVTFGPALGSATPLVLSSTGVAPRQLDLPVNMANPIDPLTATAYQMHVSLNGYDNESATITANLPSGAVTGTAASLAIKLRAGDKATLVIRLGKFGSIVGTAIGKTPSDEPLFSTPGGTVTAIRKLFPDGVTADTNNTPGTVTFDPIDLSKFTVTGPAGYYAITVAHPNFDAPYSVPVTEANGYYKMTNLPATLADPNPNILATPFLLNISVGFLDVTTLDSPSGGLVGATVDVFAGNGADTSGILVLPVATAITGSGGHVVTTGLYPGAYTVALRYTDGSGPRFPVIVDVSVQRGSTTAARTTTLTATLLQIDGGITGAIGAVNSIGDPVPLPTSINIHRVYKSGTATVSIGGGTSSNVANQATSIGDLAVNRDNANPTTPQSFTISPLARGVHTLTFSTVDGYNAPGTVDASVVGVTNTPLSPLERDYVAKDVQVDVSVVTSFPVANTPLSDAVVKLQYPSKPAITGVYNSTDKVFRFTSIPPQSGDYTLTVTHPLYDVHTELVPVSVNATGLQTVAVSLTPTKGQITGPAYVQNTATGAPTLAVGATVTLLDSVGTQVGAPITLDATGLYVFTVTVAGDYQVRLSQTGYSTRTSALLTVRLGEAITPATAITIPKQAKFTVNVSPSGVNGSLTGVGVPADASFPNVTGVCSSGTCVFTQLESGISYLFTFSANNYNSGTLTLIPDIGGDTTGSITLAQRSLTITVSTADLDSNDAKTATVTMVLASDPTTTITATHAGGTKVYTFNNLPFGAGTATIAKTLYRTQTYSLAAGTTDVAVDVDLKQLAKVQGSVRNGSGSAVNGATVIATRISPSPEVTMAAVLGTGGAYTISGLDVGSWQISGYKVGVGADIGDTVVVTPTSPSSNLVGDLTLVPRTVSISGTVTASGNPAASANVVAINTTTAATVTATAGADGTYTLTGVDVGTWQVSSYLASATAGASGAAIASPNIVITATSPITYPGTITGIDMSLVPRSVTINGTISFGGSPSIGATVTATNTSTGQSNTGTTDALGKYSFTGNDVGTWVVSAQLDNVGSAVSAPFTITAVSTNPVTVNLTLAARTVSAGGSVVASGSSVPGATINATRTSPAQTVTTTADGSGNYTLTLPNIGSWTISGYKAQVGAGTLASPVVVTATSPSVVSLPVLTLTARAVTVTGTVSQSGGVAGVTVTATNGVGGTATATTDSSGVYSIANLNVGTWTVSAYKDNTGTATGTPFNITDLSADPVTQNLTLVARSVTISGDVNAPGNDNGITITATNTLSGAVKSVTGDSSGGYSITAVNVGTWQISAYRNGSGAAIYGTNQVITGTSPAGNTITGLNMTLAARSVTISGTVSASGLGPSGATVSATSLDGVTNPTPVTADGSGNYSIVVANTGGWQISAYKDNVGIGTGPLVQVTATSPNPDTGNNVTLTARSVTVTGLVKSGGSGVTGASVVATNVITSTTTTAVLTLAGGGYTITGLNLGTWQINASLDGTGAGSTSVVIGVATPSSTAAPDILLTARLFNYQFTVTSGGTPVSGVSVTFGAGGITDINGQVTLALLETASRAWTATKTSTQFTASGTAVLGSATATTAVPVTMVAIPIISGDVQMAAVGHSATNVLLCTVNNGTCSIGGGAVLADVPTGSPTGHFSIGPVAGLTPGNYWVKAIDTTLSGITAITIASDGSITPSTLVVVLA